MLGASHIRTLTFFIYSVLSTVLWLLILGGAGYFFGAVISDKIELFQHYFKSIVVILAILLIAYFLYKKYIKNKK